MSSAWLGATVTLFLGALPLRTQDGEAERGTCGLAERPAPLEGDYEDGRRLASFHDLEEVARGKKALKAIVKQLLKQIDA